ncbi:endogenous retrovirus group 3 member 1 Env polyprotein-like [Emydura macquarii macquarii]|uniref:endogenous retrovirus group 3 member 1 Env polyprotein-like n=1 Tax=Emydura macquarii macquarii TaxID=1129001 RepID=UPI00352A02EB
MTRPVEFNSPRLISGTTPLSRLQESDKDRIGNSIPSFLFYWNAILNPGLQTSGIVTVGNTFRIHITAQPLPETEVRSVFHSYYREMEKDIPIPIVVKNMFVNLAEKVAQTLEVKNCYVCGGTNMGEQWPWEAKEINYSIANVTWTTRMEGKWVLSTNLVAKLCWSREGKTFTENVGHLRCESAYQYNETIRSTKWWTNGLSQQINLTGTEFEKWISQLGTQTISPWEAPKNIYWLCGTFAYAKLPPKWKGSCALGYIKPSFFLLPIETGNCLGVPVYKDLNSRVKRALIGTANLKIGDWKDDEWPPSRIIQYYGPATWAEDGMYGYRTPIYLLNRLIRLQAVIELLTNDTAIALNLMAKQNTQMRTAIYQNRLALDYLLAQEGGVCGKFNLTNCCIQIDDQGKAIEEITNRMVKLAHVPVQKWTGAFEEEGWFRSLFGDWKKILFVIILALGGLLFIPCLIPLIQRLVVSSIKGMTLVTTPTTKKSNTTDLLVMSVKPTTPVVFSNEIDEKLEQMISKFKN